ncbi:hypothetical protein [Marinitenerispora sediminis]|uniref:hypothetical protein n=1 Tax=Marinitenerispora sediminis TaxID=1931232 RepID=UPI0011C03C45|nr:hypothetical protein [Marinitenerispora sediminis]
MGDGVTPSSIGARVVTTLGWSGGYAELAVAAAAGVVHDAGTAVALTDAVAPGRGRRYRCWAPPAAWACSSSGWRAPPAPASWRARAANASCGPRPSSAPNPWTSLPPPDRPRRVAGATGGAGADAVLDGVGGAHGSAAV